jgi:diguanylate cyclase (GGDEF)-like protein
LSIKLRTYFAISFALIIFITSALLSFSISKISSGKLEKEVGDSLSGAAFQMTDKLDYFMWSRYQEIQVLSELQTFKSQDNEKDAQYLLDQLHTKIPSFSWIGYTDENGNIKAASDQILVGANIAKRPVFINARKEPFIGDVHDAVLLSKLIPTQNGEPLQLVDISTPIIGNNGEFKGVLAAHLSWEWAREIQDIILKPLQEKRQNVDLFIISSKDNTVLLGPERFLGKPLDLKSINAANSNKNDWKLERWPDGKSYLTGYAFGKGYKDYKGLGWTVIVRQPESVAYASVENLQKFILMIGTLSAVLMATIGWFLAGKIANPLHKIAQTANELRRGKAVEIPIMKGIKDIEVLSLSLRALVSSLIKTESELDKMETIAMHDALTGLPNRFSVYAHLNALNDDDSQKVILYLDLDGFKKINDTFGHQMGDDLLKEVGHRLKLSLDPAHFAARLGGDEFVVIMKSDTKKPVQEVKVIANQIIKTLNEPFLLKSQKAYIGCSIGAAIWPAGCNDPEEILQRADEALYISKNSGKNQVNFYGNYKVS